MTNIVIIHCLVATSLLAMWQLKSGPPSFDWKGKNERAGGIPTISLWTEKQSSIVCDKVAVVGWGGRSLSLCWVGCHARLVVGSLPFSRSGGGGRSSLLLSSSGHRWSFGMVAVWHGGRVSWLIVFVVQQWWWALLGGVVAHCCCVGWVAMCAWLWAHCHFCAVVVVGARRCCWVAVVVGGRLAWWPFGMMAGCCGSLPLLCSGGGGCRWVGWLLVVVVLVVLPCATGCGLIAIFAQRCWWVLVGAHCCCWVAVVCGH